MRNLAIQLWRDDSGQDLIEYALLAGFVAVAAAAVPWTLTAPLQQVWTKVSATLNRVAAMI